MGKWLTFKKMFSFAQLYDLTFLRDQWFKLILGTKLQRRSDKKGKFILSLFFEELAANSAPYLEHITNST